MPNTQASAVDIAPPGVLPVMNRAAVDKAIRFGLAIGAKINPRSSPAKIIFTYYLPKGYQIQPFRLPICPEGGSLQIQVGDSENRQSHPPAPTWKRRRQSLHEDFHGMTGIDLNRAGTPLLEIVSEQKCARPPETVAYARALYTPGDLVGRLRRQYAGRQLPRGHECADSPVCRAGVRHRREIKT